MVKNKAPVKIGLKYCGGCRAAYDRVALAASLKERLTSRIEFVGAKNTEAEMFLIVTGCKTACAKVDDHGRHTVCTITGPEDAERWIEEIVAE
jgi:hypothetical protein